MDVLVIVALVLMLLGVAYAQWQRGVVKTGRTLSLDEEEKKQSLH